MTNEEIDTLEEYLLMGIDDPDIAALIAAARRANELEAECAVLRERLDFCSTVLVDEECVCDMAQIAEGGAGPCWFCQIGAALAKEPPTGDITTLVEDIAAIGDTVPQEEWDKTGHELSIDPDGTQALKTENTELRELVRSAFDEGADIYSIPPPHGPGIRVTIEHCWTYSESKAALTALAKEPPA